MKSKYKIFLSIISILLLSGCAYLDMVPEKDIETLDSQFEQRGTADSWINGLYGATAGIFGDYGQNPIYLATDEFVTGEAIQKSIWYGNKLNYPGFKIANGLQMSQDPYGNLWEKGNELNTEMGLYAGIRYFNIFLEKIWGVYNMQMAEKEMWAAEIKALKAFYYFELVRRYGPIILVHENQEVNEEISKLQQQRSPVEECFKEIVKLLDEAADVLPLGNQRSADRIAYFNKEGALALKARVLVYAASPLYNGCMEFSRFMGKKGENLFPTTYDHNKWKLAAEACDKAIEAALQGGHKLNNGTSGKATELLNYVNDITFSTHSVFNNPEYIFEVKNAASWRVFLPRLVKMQYHYNEEALGCVAPSMKMVEMYYTDKGLPIEMDNSWDYTGRYKMAKESDPNYEKTVPLNTNVLQLHLRREPRFYANIAADRTYYARGPEGGYQDYNMLVEAYASENWGSSQQTIVSDGWQNIAGYWIKKFIDPKKQTIGYKNYLDETFPLIRLAELYLLQAEAWNEWEGPSAKVYGAINTIRERAGLMDVVTAWKSYSKDGSKVDTKEGMRSIIRQETNIELAFEGHRFFNVRRWMIANEELNQKQFGWNILGTNAETFYNNFTGPMIIRDNHKFTAPRDYLFPIKAEEVIISSVVQNPGW